MSFGVAKAYVPFFNMTDGPSANSSTKFICILEADFIFNNVCDYLRSNGTAYEPSLLTAINTESLA